MSFQGQIEKKSPRTLQKNVGFVIGRNDEHSGFGFPFLGIGIRSPMRKGEGRIRCVELYALKVPSFGLMALPQTLNAKHWCVQYYWMI